MVAITSVLLLASKAVQRQNKDGSVCEVKPDPNTHTWSALQPVSSSYFLGIDSNRLVAGSKTSSVQTTGTKQQQRRRSPDEPQQSASGHQQRLLHLQPYLQDLAAEAAYIH